jgi:hypothetical protein
MTIGVLSTLIHNQIHLKTIENMVKVNKRVCLQGDELQCRVAQDFSKKIIFFNQLAYIYDIEDFLRRRPRNSCLLYICLNFNQL